MTLQSELTHLADNLRKKYSTSDSLSIADMIQLTEPPKFSSGTVLAKNINLPAPNFTNFITPIPSMNHTIKLRCYVQGSALLDSTVCDIELNNGEVLTLHFPTDYDFVTDGEYRDIQLPANSNAVAFRIPSSGRTFGNFSKIIAIF